MIKEWRIFYILRIEDSFQPAFLATVFTWLKKVRIESIIMPRILISLEKSTDVSPMFRNELVGTLLFAIYTACVF